MEYTKEYQNLRDDEVVNMLIGKRESDMYLVVDVKEGIILHTELEKGEIEALEIAASEVMKGKEIMVIGSNQQFNVQVTRSEGDESKKGVLPTP